MTLARVSLLVVLAIADAVAACSSDAPAPSENAEAERTDADAALESNPTDAADDSLTDAAPACALPGTYGSKECMACVGAKCCDLVTACENDDSCKPLQHCALDCLPKPDAGGCLNDCFDRYATGRTLWDQVDHCWFGKPPNGCLVECTN